MNIVRKYLKVITTTMVVSIALNLNGSSDLYSQTISNQQVATQSWITQANDENCDYPIQNLPYGVFSRNENILERHIGVAIGDQIFDLYRAVDSGLFQELPEATRRTLKEGSLNQFMDLGKDTWKLTRKILISLLRSETHQLRDSDTLKSFLFISMDAATMHLPFNTGDYTDFYTSIHHATNVGKRFRPQNPILPNFKHLPVGYHGRASSIVISGTDVVRPLGQMKNLQDDLPVFRPSTKLDYEMELGVVVGQGNELGHRIKMRDASKHLFGIVILNDWSARDVQKWEYQPLGPFNAKNFATTISPWVVTMDALDPYRVLGPVRPAGDPEILDYLKPTEDMGLDIFVEVWLSSKQMRDGGIDPIMLSKTNFDAMYWTIAQMLVHHTSTGANMRPGDLFGTGTISGSEDGAKGCLLEINDPGCEGIVLPDGSRRSFLEDGDEVILKAYAHREGKPRIGFGECRGVVVEALESAN